MVWIYYLILLCLLMAGLFINILGLPGLWLMVAATAGFAFFTGLGTFVGAKMLIALLVLALVAEAVELFAGSIGAKKAGGGKLGMFGAVVGALVGGIFGTTIIPILGTIIGACLGAFAGAALLEILLEPDVLRAAKIGIGAAKGRFLGIALKSLFGMAILIASAIDALPIK